MMNMRSLKNKMTNAISELVKEITEMNETKNNDKDSKLIENEPIKSNLGNIISDCIRNEQNQVAEKIKYGYKEILANKSIFFDYTVSLISVWFLLYFTQLFVVRNIETGSIIGYTFAIASVLLLLVICYVVTNDVLGLIKINRLENFRNNIQSLINS